MSEHPIQDSEEDSSLKPLAIEGKLPLKTVGIENLREANPQYLPPHRYLHPWFARRPTPASRLAILASVLPQGIDSDDLLRWMQIGPDREVEGSLNEYVERKKATEDQRSGNLESHYGYPRPFTQSPTDSERTEIHETLREHWDGELPSVLDPTAGGGVIPYESLRYGLPTHANELNPVPSLILKVMLEYAPAVGDIETEVKHWAKKINDRAKPRIQEYFPSTRESRIPDNYVCTYHVQCRSCGAEIPLMTKWWIRTRSDGIRVVVRPEILDDGTVDYEVIVNPDDKDLRGFDADNGPVSRGGDAECLKCGVVTEDDEVRERFNQGEFDYGIYCVRYLKSDGHHGFRSPNKDDLEALEAARERIQSDFELSTFLSTPIPKGNKTTEPRNFGIDEWRDLFSPRQLVCNYEYVDAINHFQPRIEEEHDQKTAEAILTLLTLSFSKLIDRNIRLADWDTTKGYPNPMFKGKNFAFKRTFVENNISVGGLDFLSSLDKIYGSYTELVGYLPEDSDPANVSVGDAANLNQAEDSISAVVVDPPYYSSIMYAELSDVFYVWMRELLDDVFPDIFRESLTDKENEAVANPDRFDGVAGNGSSKRDLANDSYERKMSEIFSELYRVLEPGGVMTVMFTHKETDAWDTLTMSLINSGFTITSTHPITSEMPQRAGMRESASADSTLLLTGRKPHQERDPENAVPTLWNDVKSDTRAAAKNAARDLIDSGLSLTKTDVIISAFGPTLRVFADAYPVVDDEDNEVPPRRALEEAREAVTQVLVDEYLEAEGIGDLDDITEWYILCWLVHESDTFSYDEGLQLGYGIGVDVDDIKRSTKTWRKSRGDMRLRGHTDRVQNANEKPENRSSRTPVNPDDLSFGLALDKVHAAMHIYDVMGESACCDWLRERNFGSDSTFKATLQAFLQVLPHDHEDWELARDLAVGRTRDVLDLDFGPNVFADDGDGTSQSELSDH
jgi:adenine-specific DNA methylase